MLTAVFHVLLAVFGIHPPVYRDAVSYNSVTIFHIYFMPIRTTLNPIQILEKNFPKISRKLLNTQPKAIKLCDVISSSYEVVSTCCESFLDVLFTPKVSVNSGIFAGVCMRTDKTFHFHTNVFKIFSSNETLSSLF